jgi:hypothetical protein
MDKRVVVVGGGVAGLTAAHELLKRGFRVVLIERRKEADLGGRARSFHADVRDPQEGRPSGRSGPAEHGFRFFPGFYRHLDDTMSRIPRSGAAGAGTVLDNLVAIDEEWLSVSGQRIVEIPAAGPGGEHPTRRLMELLRLPKRLEDVGLTREDLEIFTDRLFQFATSSTIRRNVEYERLGWREYVESLDRSHEYYWYLASGLTRTLVAAKASKASTKTMGNTALRLMSCYLDRERTSDRVLNGPTNDAWFLPWLEHLRRIGNGRFEYFPDTTAKEVVVEGGRIVGVKLIGRHGEGTIDGVDYAIVALSAFALKDLVSRSPALAGALGEQACRNIASLVDHHFEAMHGLQIFSRKPLPLNRGHQIFLDSPWGLTSLAQGKFWQTRHLPQGIADILSIDISSWDLPGERVRVSAAEAASKPKAIFDEVLHQLSVALGSDFLPLKDIVGWYLDEGIGDIGERVMVNNVGSWALRPSVAATDFDEQRETRGGPTNLYLAGDWIRSKTDLACMEGANETARRAVNEVLKATGWQGQPCQLFDPEELEPDVFKPLKQMDAARFNRGLPWSSIDPGALAIRSVWASHTLGAIVLGQDEGGGEGPRMTGAGATMLAAPGGVPSQRQRAPEPVPGRTPYRPPRELWHPAYKGTPAGAPAESDPGRDDAAPIAVSATGPHGGFDRQSVERAVGAARPLSETEIEHLLRTVASGPGRSDPMFQRWRPSLMTIGGKAFPIPFLVYDGDTVVVHGRVRNISSLREWTEGTGYQPVFAREGKDEIGFAELWLVRYTDTIGGVYDEVVLNFVVTRSPRGPYRWRSPYSCLVPMMDNANRLFTPRLVLDVKEGIGPGPIEYGNALFGMDKRPGRIETRRQGYVRRIECWDAGRRDGEPVLKVRVDESPSVALDLESGIELSRELGAIELLKNARQIREGKEVRGGMISPDFRVAPTPGRRFGRRQTVDVQARYKFNPRLIPLGPKDLQLGERVSAGGGNLAQLMDQMGFEAQIAAVDHHLKSVLLLDGWPTPDDGPSPDRPPRPLFSRVLGV